MRVNGYKVVVAGSYPKMTLSEKVPVTPEFRVEINAWMQEFFGMVCLVERGQVIVSETQGIMFVHPADYMDLKRVYSSTEKELFS